MFFLMLLSCYSFKSLSLLHYTSMLKILAPVSLHYKEKKQYSSVTANIQLDISDFIIENHILKYIKNVILLGHFFPQRDEYGL